MSTISHSVYNFPEQFCGQICTVFFPNDKIYRLKNVGNFFFPGNLTPFASKQKGKKKSTFFKKERKKAMKVVFDIDNTLYSFKETGFDTRMHDRIIEYIVEHKIRDDWESARELANHYYHTYGLAGCGLHKYHGVDLVGYCRFVNSCDYSRLSRDATLVQMLDDLKAEGHELWIMTNADMPHAYDVLNALEILSYFVNEKNELRGFDCFLQWEQSEPPMQNKPMVGAYEALHRMMDPSVSHSDVVMIDDAFPNLEQPHKLGWKTVWIAHGKELPSDAAFTPTVVVQTIQELPAHPMFAKLSA